MKKFRLLGTKILVKRFGKNEKTATGFVLPDNMQKAPSRGKVITTGPGKRLNDGKLIPLEVKENNIICFNEYAGQYLESDDRTKDSDLIILESEDEILAIEEES